MSADPANVDIEEPQMDLEAIQDNAQINREIDALGFDPERFEDIEREFK
jgi:hypothetical protein